MGKTYVQFIPNKFSFRALQRKERYMEPMNQGEIEDLKRLRAYYQEIETYNQEVIKKKEARQKRRLERKILYK